LLITVDGKPLPPIVISPEIKACPTNIKKPVDMTAKDINTEDSLSITG
jgi:hypothetical protein